LHPAGWRLRRKTTRILQRPAEKVFDLRVHAAQLVRGPALHRLVRLRVDPQQDGLLLGHDYVYSVPVFTTGCVFCSLHRTTRRLLTIAALRSSSSSTTLRFDSSSSAISTMPTAPSTIRDRAATTALACWRRSIA